MSPIRFCSFEIVKFCYRVGAVELGMAIKLTRRVFNRPGTDFECFF